ncbi:MAG: hypothetical protein J6R35_04350, partial [Clostridia bacterium]|nr:hypothetical protein [Clostridia bacterium]
MQREDYPIPNFVRPRIKLLNGEWDYEILSLTGEVTSCGQATLPYELGSIRSGCPLDGSERIVRYTHTFDLNASECLGTTLLNFIAVSYTADIRLNGVPVCVNVGNMHSMHFDVTQLVKEGKNVIELIASRENEDVPLGILGDVWLEFSAKTYFTAVRSYGSLMDKTIYLQGALSGETEGYKVKLEIAYNKKQVATYEYKANPILNLGAALKTQTVYLWQINEPRIYEIRLSLYNAGGGLCDQIYTYCAFRDIDLVEGKLYVNGRPTFIRAIESRGTYPYSGATPLDSKTIAQDYATLLMLGFNAIHFKGRYPTPKELYLADKLGIAVRAEFTDNKRNLNDQREFEVFAGEIQAVINRDFGHPSILFWVPFSEFNGNPILQSGTYTHLKNFDPTRVIVGSSGGALYKTDVYEFIPEESSAPCIEDYLIHRHNGMALSEKEDHKRRKANPDLLTANELYQKPFYVGRIIAGNLRAN